jgi:predicted short-subunit dehydrogenase-like oxidoreductase (DUF2520 family)
MPDQTRISIIGSGNLAWHLAAAFKKKKHAVTVYPRDKKSDVRLFKKAGITLEYTKDNIGGDQDFYFLCVPDARIGEVSERIHPENEKAVIVHTAGSVGINTLGSWPKKAVMYPLQTFSKQDAVSFENVPLMVFGSTTRATQLITNLAAGLSNNVRYCTDTERLRLHLAAVFAANFSNAMYGAASTIAGDKFHLLIPLILQTASKMQLFTPAEAQTGPAVRNDEAVIRKHLRALSQAPDLQQIYELLTSYIRKNAS